MAILGGGPAGCATALSLRAHDPSLTVRLIEPSSYDRVRAGEVLPSVTRALLEHLGVWGAFQDGPHRTAYASAAAWGDPSPRENHFLYSMHGPGWHVDRVAFDAMLAHQAEQRGVEVLRNRRAASIERCDDHWRLTLSGGSEFAARFLDRKSVV